MYRVIFCFLRGGNTDLESSTKQNMALERFVTKTLTLLEKERHAEIEETRYLKKKR